MTTPRTPTPSPRHYLGLDLGQARDYSGVAILERRVEPLGTYDPVTFARHERTRILVNHIERIPLRTQYPDVVERIRALVEDRSRQKRHLEILLDATGVGAVVRDMLKRAGLGSPSRNASLRGTPLGRPLRARRSRLCRRPAAWKAGGQPLTLNGAGPIPMVYPEVRK